MAIPLSKTLAPVDFDALVDELAVVDQVFTSRREQHPMRRWEYAIALHAYDQWNTTSAMSGPIYDVGGAGSPFYRMLDPYQVRVIDPEEGADLATVLREGPRLGAAVFCLSVLEHVDDLDRFLYHLSCLVAPGGLLFLTFDYCDDVHVPAEDRFHFHWMRRRIFNRPTLKHDILQTLLPRDFQPLGEIDLDWHGPQVYDYTFASLALVKRA